MAETKQTQQAEGQQPSPRPCPQDCNRCSISQQVFCCTRMLFDLSRAEAEARRQIAEVERAVADISAQLQSGGMQQPSVPLVERNDTAQQGGGAKE